MTPRERQVVEMSADGTPRKVIARRLGISHYTVKALRYRAYRKLGVRRHTQIAATLCLHEARR